MDVKNIESVFLGGMLGCALGDAIGELAFKYFPEEFLLPVITREPFLKYTDDTAMTIGVAESICSGGDLDTQAVGEIFRKNYKKEPDRGYGGGPPSIFYLVENKGVSYEEASRKIYDYEGSYGNGAAMRVAPLGMFYYDVNDLSEKVRIASLATHAHHLGIEGAVLLAHAVAEAVRARGDHDIDIKNYCSALRNHITAKEFIEKIGSLEKLLQDQASAVDAGRELGNTVAALDSVPFAIFCFLKNYGSFEECLFDSTLSGGDKDTLGAMACSISGAYLGVEKLPGKWVNKVENLEYIKGLAHKMAEAKINNI